MVVQAYSHYEPSSSEFCGLCCARPFDCNTGNQYALIRRVRGGENARNKSEKRLLLKRLPLRLRPPCGRQNPATPSRNGSNK
eukprot:3772297-Amphidinium_carterae.1